jgi:cystathionine gamma-synthase
MATMKKPARPQPENNGLNSIPARPRGIATRAARLDPIATTSDRSRPLIEPIVQSTVFAFDDLDAVDVFYTQSSTESHLYYRYGHPNAATLERLLADLDGGVAAVVASSGMAAITALVLSLCDAGDHLVLQLGAYGGTHVLARDDLARLGIEMTLSAGDADAVASSIRSNTRLVLLEALTNPLLRVPDIDAVARVCREHRCPLAVDSSFISPALLRPIEHGADVVIHSLPKYLGGHSAAMGGAIVGRADVADGVRLALSTQGATIGPFDAWMATQGIRTLPLRMRAHSENALAVATWLSSREGVCAVHYPGLPSHPDYELASRLLPNGHGGMIAFDLDGGAAAARTFLGSIGKHGIPFTPSLADLRTTASYPAGTSHRSLDAAERRDCGIGDGLIRLSVGIEDVDDIIAGLDAAIASITT